MRQATYLASTALIAFSLFGVGASAKTSKADYDAAKEKAKAEYRVADDQCASLASNAKDVCKAQAKAAHKKADAMAEADYKATPKAHQEAAEEVAEADYDVAREKCNAKTGNDKDVCVKEAKAVQDQGQGRREGDVDYEDRSDGRQCRQARRRLQGGEWRSATGSRA